MNFKEIFRQLLSIVVPQIIFRTRSPLSGEVKVMQHFGQRSLVVDDLVQSVSPSAAGRVWERLVESVLRRAKREGLPIKNILLLGLGGGTMSHLFKKGLGSVPIDAVEIDSVIVDLAYKYFGLGKLRGLRTIVGDAVGVVTHPQDFTLSFPKYSVIVVDLYLGPVFPSGAQSEEFLLGLANLLENGGLAVVNRAEKDDQFSLLLGKFFADLEVTEVVARGGGINYLYLGRKE